MNFCRILFIDASARLRERLGCGKEPVLEIQREKATVPSVFKEIDWRHGIVGGVRGILEKDHRQGRAAGLPLRSWNQQA